MKVILLEELKGRGGEGDVVEVATGYAVNYLLPRKIAILATKGNLKQLEMRKHNIARREASRLDTADKQLEALEGQRIRIGAKVGEEGQLFGSVTPQRVADAINAKFGTSFDRKRIDLTAVIKKAGEHTASVSIYRDSRANIIIEVVDEKKLAELEKAEAAAAKAGVEVADAEEAAAEVEATEAEVEAALEAEAAGVVEAEAVVEEAAADEPAEDEAVAEAAEEAEESV